MSKRKKRLSAPLEASGLRNGSKGFDPDVRTGTGSGAASACECTGLIPQGGDLTEDEFESSKDLFPFSGPDPLPR